MPDVAAAQVLTLLRRGHLAAAQHLAETHELPISRARVDLARGDTSAALAVLLAVYDQANAKGWPDEQLTVTVLLAVVLHAHGEMDRAMAVLGDALALAQPGGFIRSFVDEGPPMARLLHEAAAHTMMPDYIGTLLAAWEAEQPKSEAASHLPAAVPSQPLSEPLSQREREVLRLMTEGLSNREIGERLYLALSTVKGHNLRIFGKLQVQRRTEAVARARELGLV